MTPTVRVDLTEFQQAMREYIATSRRTLAEIVNSRAFYVQARVFLLLDPQNPQAERNRIRAYFREPLGDVNKVSSRTGKRLGKSRLLRRVHLIAQMKNAKAGKPGLYGETMKKAAASLMRRAIGSVGYMKSPVAKALKKLSGHFSQFGGTAGSIGGVRPYAGNAALIKLADEYGIGSEARSNVALHKGAHAYVQRARTAINPICDVDLALSVANDQTAEVQRRYASAFSRAFADEEREMRRHVAEKMQEITNRHNVRKV